MPRNRVPLLDIALDIEGVLADTHRATEERSDWLTAENCPPADWDFPSEEHYKEFMHVSQNLWHNHHEQIPPMPQPSGWDLGRATSLMSTFHNVDIITHRDGVPEQLQSWLDEHNVEYRDFFVTSGDKTEVGDHHVHIDDGGHNAEDALDAGRVVLLVDRPYNQSVDCTADRIERVPHVKAASRLLCDAGIVDEIRRLSGETPDSREDATQSSRNRGADGSADSVENESGTRPDDLTSL